MGETIVATLRDTWLGFIGALSLALPRVLALASVVVAGWLVAVVGRLVTRRLLAALRIGRLTARAGFAELLRKAELPAPEQLLASAVFWLLFVGFLLAGLDAAGIASLEGLRAQLLSLVPRLVAALANLALGIVLANVVWRIVLLAAVNAGWPRARAIGGTVHAVLVILAVAMALDHLGVARGIVISAFAIAYGAVLLTAAIALGIALAPALRRQIDERLEQRGRGEPDGSSHL